MYSKKLNLPAIESNKPKYFPNTKQYRQSAMPQEFLFPMPLIKYISENPFTPEVYQKLVKSCKLFFLKNPILVFTDFKYAFSNDKKFLESIQGKPLRYTKRHDFDIDKYTGKLWIKESFNVWSSQKLNFIGAIIPKIYKYDFKSLNLTNQLILFEDLKLLAAGVKECELSNITVTYDNDEEVSLENIIQLFSGAEKVTINFDYNLDNATCKNYVEFINACNSIKEVRLHQVPAVFDVLEFYQHLKVSKNQTSISILSSFNSDRLDEVIIEILQTKFFEFVPPVIEYSGHDFVKFFYMKLIQTTAFAGYF